MPNFDIAEQIEYLQYTIEQDTKQLEKLKLISNNVITNEKKNSESEKNF